MDLNFAQPAGWWFLLGIPVIIAIHFLQSRTRQIQISTLFLVEPMAEENRRGAIWTRLRQSPQMWLQLLAVLLLTWLALNPMWLRPESVQSVALVLDQSYSMQAFRAETISETRKLIADLDRGAGRTEWYVLSSDVTQPVIYRGDVTGEAEAALNDWLPNREGHNPDRSLRRARDLVGPDGVIVFISDHTNTVVPSGVHLLAVGYPVANSGFTGIRFERNERGETEWVATLMHFGLHETSRAVRIGFDDLEPVASESVQLLPGRLVNMRGVMPSGARRGNIQLHPDRYPVDDTMFFVAPEIKPVFYSLTGFGEIDEWPAKVMSAVDAAHEAPDHINPSITWRSFAGNRLQNEGQGVWMYSGDAEAGYDSITAIDHPLTRDLNWAGFLGRVAPEFERQAGDITLVWMGRHPLVVLRESRQGAQLILCFDPMRSNADRLPAVILCLHRFIESVRSRIEGYEAVNVETHQALTLRGDATVREEVDGQIKIYQADGRMPMRASALPGFLRISYGDQVGLDAGIHVADTAEANLMNAASVAPDAQLLSSLQIINSRRDMMTPLWFTLLGLAILGSWITGRSGNS